MVVVLSASACAFLVTVVMLSVLLRRTRPVVTSEADQLARCEKHPFESGCKALCAHLRARGDACHTFCATRGRDHVLWNECVKSIAEHRSPRSL